jgi:N-acetylneuraminic acid mutarotase
VLVAGGLQLDPPTLNSAILDSAELFDPATETFTSSNSHLTVPREGATATPLNNGKVLIAGGSQRDRRNRKC